MSTDRKPYTIKQIDEGERLARLGCSVEDVASALKMSKTALYDSIKTPKTRADYNMKEALEAGRVELKSNMLSCILRAAVLDKDWKAAAWLLERKYPGEFSRATRTVQTQEGEAPFRGGVVSFSRQAAEGLRKQMRSK